MISSLSAAHIGGAAGSDDIRVQEEAKWVFERKRFTFCSKQILNILSK